MKIEWRGPWATIYGKEWECYAGGIAVRLSENKPWKLMGAYRNRNRDPYWLEGTLLSGGIKAKSAREAKEKAVKRIQAAVQEAYDAWVG